VNDYTLIAPQATNNTWYPYSFLEPPIHNEPWLSSAITLLGEMVADIAKTVDKKNIYFLGFSQGACLTLEFITRNAQRYGGCIAFTGGLIGDKLYTENYKGDFENTPVFIGTSDPDPHVPVQRVRDTVKILRSMNASVTEKIYERIGHTVIQDEFDHANEILRP
jgi:phospholipase/carboxylesterase